MKTCSSESQSPRMCGLLSPVCPRENPVYLRNLWGRWLILMGFLKQIQGVEPRKCDRRWHGNPWKSWRQAFQWEHRSISGGFSSFQLSMWTMVVEFSWDQSSAMGLLDEHGWTIWVRWFGWFDGNLTSWWFIMMFDVRKKQHSASNAESGNQFKSSRQGHLSGVQNRCWLMITGDYTTQYIGGYNKPIGESLSTNQ